MSEKSRSLQVYDSPEFAERFSTTGGFAPERKERMLEVARELLLALSREHSRVLELGAGTGDFTGKIAAGKQFDEIVVTDGAAAMLDVARERLAGAYPALRFEMVDFSAQWAGRFGVNSFDSVVSTLALHHAVEKRPLFRQVFDVLKPGGVFVLGDHVAAVTRTGRYLIGRERAFERLNRPDVVAASLLEEAMAFDTQRQIDEGNNCEPAGAYIKMLVDSGFEEVECLWQDYWLALFVALKPQ
jgi:tRNA (cmo5U34)-methyltransferase